MNTVYYFLFLALVKVVHSSSDFLLRGSSYSSSSKARTKASKECDRPSSAANPKSLRYFDGMKSIYFDNKDQSTCLPQHRECGWAPVGLPAKHLPTFVLSVGLEGAGHHLWTELLQEPVVDCLWVNGRHYRRDIGDGVPRTTVEDLKQGILEQYALREQGGKSRCELIYDAEDSFPTGAIRKSGRIFMRPDLVNIEKLHGVIFNVKYLIITRNVTDTAISALRRNFYTNIEAELRTVEHTLSYIEAALKAVSCSRIFIANYEHVLADPIAYINPLTQFLGNFYLFIYFVCFF